jgi:hypothetical protein
MSLDPVLKKRIKDQETKKKEIENYRNECRKEISAKLTQEEIDYITGDRFSHQKENNIIELSASECNELGKSEKKEIENFYFPDWAAAMPPELIRSSLFSFLGTKEKSLVNNKLVPSRSDVKLFFTGEELSIHDETIYLALLRLARHKNIGEKNYFQISTLCKELKVKPTGGKNGNIKVIVSSIKRLAKATIEIEFKRKEKKSVVSMHLLNFGIENVNDVKLMYIRLDPESANLFKVVAYQNWETRLSLKSDMAKKLFTYISSHQAKTKYNHKINDLINWFNFKREAYRFRPLCFSALNEIENLGVISNLECEKDYVSWFRN